MDQQKYINTYVDKSVGMLHEYVSMILQLRTQLHIANDLIKEKDQVISDLQEINDKTKFDESELSKAKQSAQAWEDQYNVMKNKAAHIDTFSNQINEMKQALLLKTAEHDEYKRKFEDTERALISKESELHILKNEIIELKKLLPKESKKETIQNDEPKKVINTKSKTKPVVIESEKPPEETDDF